MIIFKLFIFILLYLNKELTKAIVVNTLAYISSESDPYSFLVDKFNEYSEANNLDVTIKLTLVSKNNFTSSDEDYPSTVEALLKKKLFTYDLYFYDNAYSAKYGEYLINLYDYLSPEHIEMYHSDILSNSCIYNDKLVGLPVFMYYSVFYSNKKLLNIYNKRIPKLWDELIETSKYILRKEKEKGSNIIGYNGLFTDDENGSNSIYEFINSFRKSVNDEFPEFTSSTANEALQKLKEIKNYISSDDQFKASKENVVKNLNNKNYLFLKFWKIPDDGSIEIRYYLSPLLGNKSGISSSMVYGKYLGVSKLISKEKKQAAVEVLKYFTSKDVQKQLLRKFNHFYSAIPRLYNDKRFCSHHEVNCYLLKSIQPVVMPIINDYDNFERKLRKSTYDYLYGNTKSEVALENINNYLNGVNEIEKDNSESPTNSTTTFDNTKTSMESTPSTNTASPNKSKSSDSTIVSDDSLNTSGAYLSCQNNIYKFLLGFLLFFVYLIFMSIM